MVPNFRTHRCFRINRILSGWRGKLQSQSWNLNRNFLVIKDSVSEFAIKLAEILFSENWNVWGIFWWDSNIWFQIGSWSATSATRLAHELLMVDGQNQISSWNGQKKWDDWFIRDKYSISLIRDMLFVYSARIYSNKKPFHLSTYPQKTKGTEVSKRPCSSWKRLTLFNDLNLFPKRFIKIYQSLSST